MSSRVALVGFVNSEEILADTIRAQSPDVSIDGYELFPNEAFGRLVDSRYKLWEEIPGEADAARYQRYINRLRGIGYSAVNLGPDTAALLLEKPLVDAGVEYVGPRTSELGIELDKTKIFDIFPESSGVLPPTRILERSDLDRITSIVDGFGGQAFVKFVGDYADYYDDSEYRRVRSLGEFQTAAKLKEFLANSIDSSGKAIIQQKITGQEFSYTCLVDRNDGIFRLGENIFYKRRLEGDLGPLCDGTGSVALDNTLPGLLASKDISYIEEKIVRPYTRAIASRFGQAPQTFLNVDLIKDDNGKIYLLEVNNRQPGGHTMSTLLRGLETPLAEVLEAAQANRLTDIAPRYKDGAAVAVTVFPEISPSDFSEGEERPVITIPKNKTADEVRLYTGWVDMLHEDSDTVTIQTNLTATVIAVNHAPTIESARRNVYAKLASLGLDHSGLTYRSDIGHTTAIST